MRRSLAVLVLALAFIAGACGDDGGGGSDSAYCKGLKSAAEEALRTTSTSAADMAGLRTSFESALDKISDKAPGEIKDDYAVLKEYVGLRFQAVIEPTKAAELQPRLTEITPKYNEAQKAITDYNTKVCKFQTPTSAASGGAATTATTAKK